MQFLKVLARLALLSHRRLYHKKTCKINIIDIQNNRAIHKVVFAVSNQPNQKAPLLRFAYFNKIYRSSIVLMK